MRVIGQPDPAVLDERLDHQRFRALALPRCSLPGQIRPNSLAIHPEMTSDRRYRPTLLPKRMHFHITLQRQQTTALLTTSGNQLRRQ